MKKVLLHLLLYPAYAMGGIYFFYMDPMIKSAYFVLLFLVLVYYKKMIRSSFLLVSMYIGMLFCFQYALYERGSLYNYIGLIVVFGIPYLIWKIYNLNFIKYIVNIVFIISIVSLTFWVLSNVSKEFYRASLAWPALLKSDPWINESYMLYSTREVYSIFGLLRNNGGFWEPGAFGTTMVLILFLSLLENPSIKDKKNIIFIISILTTFSTSAYISLVLLLVIYIYNSSISSSQRKIRIILLIMIGILITVNVEFIGSKIQKQYILESRKNILDPTSGRFFSARKSLIGIGRHPILGEYLVQERDVEVMFKKEDLGLYGFFYLIQRIGIPTFILFLYCLFRGFLFIINRYDYRKYNKKLAFIMMMAWLAVMFAQNLYWMPVSLFIFWVGVDSILLTARRVPDMNRLKMSRAAN